MRSPTAKARRGFAAVLLLVLCGGAAAGQQPRSRTLGVVNGEVITEDSVRKAAARELDSAEQKRARAEAAYQRETHEIMERTLDTMIQDALLRAEAGKRNIPQDALIRQEVDAKVPIPTLADVEAFYNQNKARIQGTREQAFGEIRLYLTDQRRTEALRKLLDRLRAQYEVNSDLETWRVDVATAGHPIRGNPDAPVTLVEFSDFECPYCGGLFPTLKQIEENHRGNVRVVYRQYPLASHRNAQKAAEASLCANEQNRFWDFHDALFANQRDLTVDALKRRADELRLDTKAFNKCLDSGKHADTVRRDIQEGSLLGVTGTPALFINGRPLSGNQPYAVINGIVEEELRRARSTSSN